MQQGLTRTQLPECKDEIVLIRRSAVSNVTLIKCPIVTGAGRAACLTRSLKGIVLAPQKPRDKTGLSGSQRFDPAAALVCDQQRPHGVNDQS